MPGYKIALRNEKITKYHTIAWIFLLFNVVAGIWISILKENKLTTGFIFVVLPTMVVLYLHYRYIKKGGAIRNFKRYFLILTLPWIFLELYWIAGFVFLFGYLYGIAIRNLIVYVNTDIVYPSFPTRTIQWKELNNVVLKDGLLTIDFKSNKIIQQLVEKREPVIDEKEFNDFCKKQLPVLSL